jgi:hypothetical protein
LSGRVGDATQINALYIQGWNPGLSPVFRYGTHRSRGHLRIKSPGWSVEAGEIRPPNSLTGVVTPSDGVYFQKTRGLLIGSLAAARPKYFGGGWGGYLLQGRAGLGFKAGSISLLASDVSRPTQSSRITANTFPEDDSEMIVEDLERIGALLSRENRIRSGGLETRLSFGAHSITARGGWLDLINSTDERTSGPVASGSYVFRGQHGSVSGQFRKGPGSLQGIAIPGDQVTLGGRLTVVGPFALIGRTYWQESSLLGRIRPTRAAGASAGIEYSKSQSRFYLHGNYRESDYLVRTLTRSLTAGLRLPMGAVGLDGAVQYGEADDGRQRRRIASYRGSFYAEGEHASLMLSGSYRDYGISKPRMSLDLSGSVDWRGATLEAGTGISRAGVFGDLFNAYTTLEFPLPGDLSILLGADYDRWSFVDSPYLIFLEVDDAAPPWRFTVNVKRQLSLPMPFNK